MPRMDPRLPFEAEPAPPAQPARVRRRLRNHQESRAQRRKVLSYGLLGVSFVLMVNAVIGENGYLATVRAQREYDRVMNRLNAISDDNARLSDEINRLQSDPAALEEAARRELGLMRPGETLIVIKDARPPLPAPQRR
jgi:cell division protein FtsB